MSIAYLADERVRLLLKRLGWLYETLEHLERNDCDNIAVMCSIAIDELLHELDDARLKAAADAAQNGRGGE